MSILVDQQTRLLVQGIAAPEGLTYVEHMIAAGSPIVAGVTFGQGGGPGHRCQRRGDLCPGQRGR